MSQPRLATFACLLLLVGCSVNITHTSSQSSTPTVLLTPDGDDTNTGRWRAGEDAFDPDTGCCQFTVTGPQDATHHLATVNQRRIESIDTGYRITSAVGSLTLQPDPDREHAGTYAFAVEPDLATRYPRITGDLSHDDLVTLIIAGVEDTYLDTLAAEGYAPTWRDVTRLRTAGVSAQFVNDMRRARSTPVPAMQSLATGDVQPLPAPAESPTPFSVDQIVYLSQRGVDASYVEAMQSAGYRFDAEQLYYLRSRGIDADYAATWRKIGYDLSHEQLYYLRSRGIDADFARGFVEAGYKLDTRELYYLRSRGIDADFAAAWRKIGYNLSHEDLYYLRSHGIDADYARGMREAGYDLSPKQLYYLRSHGIDVDFAAKLAVPGLEPLTPEQLYKLRSTGVDPETVNRLRKPAEQP